MERSLTRIPPLHTIASSRVEREKFESRDYKNNKDNDIINNRESRGGGLMMERNTNANATANTSSTSGARAGVGAAESNNSQRGSNLLERFRAIVREREEEFNRPLREEQIVSLYKNAVSELTFNSKLIITDLTIIAGEQSHAAKGIAATVCARISEVLGELKVYTLYLLDSIVKNIGGDYVKYFEARLSEVFIDSYTQVDEGSQRAMEHLFRTWGRVFHSAPLRIIEEDLQIPPDSPSSGTTSSRPPESQTQRPGHSIHVNPKYLEARQQFEQSSMVEGSNSEINEDSSSPEPERSGRSIHESPKRWPEDSRRLHPHRPESADAFLEPGYGQKSATSYSDYDFSVSPSRIRLGRSISPFSRMGVGKPSSPVSRLRGGRVASPPRVGIGRDPSPSSVGGRSAPLASSRVGVGRTPSPSRIVGRLNDRNAEQDNGWERPWGGKGDGDRLRQLDTANASVAYGSRNGYDWRHQPMHGALIDAYGNYRGQRSSRGLLSHVQPPHEIDVISSRMVSRNWRNSEEEEYLWEDMSPRLENPCRGSDNSRKDDYFPGDLKKWSGLEREKRMGLESALPDSDWQTHGPLSHMDRPMMSDKERRPPRRESEERQPSSLLQSGIVSQNIRDTSTATSSLLQSSQGALGHRPVMGRPPPLTHQNHSPTSQSRLRTLQVSVPGHSNSSSGLASSFNLTHSAGHPVASVNDFRSAGIEMPLGMVPKSRTNAGSSLGSDPLSFEFLSPVTPSSSSVPFSQRQQSQRLASHSPITQSLRPSMQTLPPLPPSAPPLQHQQFQPPNHQHQTNFMKPGQSQVQLPSLHSQGHSSQSFQQSPLQSQPVQQIPQQLPQLQQVSQSQAAPELLNQLPHNLPQVNQIPQQLPIPQEVQPILRTPFQQITSSQALTQSQPPQQSQLSYVASQTMGSAVSSSVTNPNSGLASRPALLPVVPNNLSSQVLGVQPPLPPGPPPASLLVASTSQTSQLTTSNTMLPSSIGNVSSLLKSLMAQGVICAETPAASSSCPSIPVSLAAIPNQFPDNNATIPAVSTTASLFPAPSLNATPPKSVPAEALAAAQDMIGTQFSSDILKVRHEFVLRTLYEDLPRQCTTCGLRFKFQEEHSNHMDWHVSRNRTVSKSRKQKAPQSVSRKWFVSAKEWLSGTEMSTSEVVPTFSPVETTLDKKDSEEVAVPADDKQSVCVLCGELFDYFYSDETDEWMYKGAVYMQAPTGSTEGIDGSKLGPIVHAKCRSESVGASFADSEEDEQDGNDDSGNRRKRIRC